MSDGRPVVLVGRLMDESKLRGSGTGGAAFLRMKLMITRHGKQERGTAIVKVSVEGRLAET